MPKRKAPKPKRKAPKIRIPFGAAIYGTVTESVSRGRRAVSVHGDGGRFTSLLVKRGAFEAVLPGAEIVGVPAGPIYIAWDGERYVIEKSLKDIQADDKLTLIGSVDGPKVQTSLPPKSTLNFEAVLPGAEIAGVPAGPIFIAWDGEQYVIKESLKDIQADDKLTLIGSVDGSKVQTSLPPKSTPNSASPTLSVRMPSTVHSLVAVRRIEEFMAKKGLSQTEFATRANTTDKTIRKIRKTATIKRSMLDDIAKALGTTREELLKES